MNYLNLDLDLNISRSGSGLSLVPFLSCSYKINSQTVCYLTDTHLLFLQQIRTSTPKKPSSSHSFPVPMGSEIFEARPTSDSDSDESEKDHYFSDE